VAERLERILEITRLLEGAVGAARAAQTLQIDSRP
jgi:hypothetical protein